VNLDRDLIGAWPPSHSNAEDSRDIAVALGHDPASRDLPRVVASGKGAVARQILEIAFARGIKVREDSDLAEVLAAVEIDSEIPLAAFAAVAEILSYVYRAQGAAREASPSPSDAPTPSTGEMP